jgi:O-antigen/teichoic acid export membrane protein
MSLFRRAYSVIFIVILLLGVLLTPFVHHLVDDDLFSKSYLQIIFFLFIIKTSISYLFGYNSSLLFADQKQYLITIISTLIKIFFAFLTIFILYNFENYVLYLSILILQTFITNILIAVYVKKKYPYLNFKYKLEKQERNQVFKNIGDLFIKRVSGVITSSTDSILISILASTIILGIYSNYVLIFSFAKILKQQFTTAISASIGNLMFTENNEKNVSVLTKLTFLYFIFGLILISILISISNDLIIIWIGEEFTLEALVINVVLLNLFLEIISDPLWQFLEVSGLFKLDKYIGIIGSIVNLIISILLGLKFGIIGIFIGTLSTQLIQIFLKTKLVFKMKFHTSDKYYYRLWLKMIFSVSLIVVSLNYLIKIFSYQSIVQSIITNILISILTASIIILVLFYKNSELVYFKKLLSDYFGNKAN